MAALALWMSFEKYFVFVLTEICSVLHRKRYYI